jgi:LysM repeat protein
MTPRSLFVLLSLAVVAAVLVAACGGGGDNKFQPGHLTNPETVATATPWQQPPEVVLLDPNNIKPISGEGATPAPTPAPGQPGVCGATYTVVSGDTTYGIADKCGVDPQALIDANSDIDPRALHVGQVLKLPAAASETPTPTASP